MKFIIAYAPIKGTATPRYLEIESANIHNARVQAERLCPCGYVVKDIFCSIGEQSDQKQPEQVCVREQEFLYKYGEFVDKTAAARILNVTRATIYAMITDGRIASACEGRKVDVRSIARYIGKKPCRKRKQPLGEAPALQNYLDRQKEFLSTF